MPLLTLLINHLNDALNNHFMEKMFNLYIKWAEEEIL